MNKRTWMSICVTALTVSCAGIQQRGTLGNTHLSKSLTPDETKSIKAIEQIGLELYKKDHLAALGTDVLRSHMGNAKPIGFFGWLVREQKETPVVTFYLYNDDRLSVLADIMFSADSPPKNEPQISLHPQREVSQLEVRMIAARTQGLKAGVNGCSERFNTVVFERPDGAFEVYVLAATTDPDAIVIGGHSKITISPDGDKVLAEKRFSASCLVVDKTPDDLPDGVKISGHYITHVISELPAETHVFFSLLHEISFFVVTERGVFSVSQGKISLVE